MTDRFDLTGAKALVVGCEGPGPAVARALAEHGADVAIASATLDGDEVMAAKRAAKAVAALGRASLAQGWDVTLPTNIQVGLKQIIREFGHPTILVFNADAPLSKPLEKVTDSEFGRVVNVNLAGAFSAARSFVRELPEGVPGRLIYLTAAPPAGSAAYAAAKAGVHGLVAALAQELAVRGITVNAIGYAAQATEAVAALTILLASPAGAGITGQVLQVASPSPPEPGEGGRG